jgi:hypothetical protein
MGGSMNRAFSWWVAASSFFASTTPVDDYPCAHPTSIPQTGKDAGLVDSKSWAE